MELDYRHALIIDDEPDIRLLLERLLLRNSYEVEQAESLEAARNIQVEDIDLIFLDIHLPDGNGLQFIDELKEKYPNAKIAMCSAFDGAEERQHAKSKGVTHFFSKPLNRNQILEEIIS